MPYMFIPVVQFHDAGTAGHDSNITSYNEDLRPPHTQVVRAAVRHAKREPATTFDEPERLAAPPG